MVFKIFILFLKILSVSRETTTKGLPYNVFHVKHLYRQLLLMFHVKHCRGWSLQDLMHIMYCASVMRRKTEVVV